MSARRKAYRNVCDQIFVCNNVRFYLYTVKNEIQLKHVNHSPIVVITIIE